MDMKLTRRKFVGGMGAAALAVASGAALAGCSSSSEGGSEGSADASKEALKLSIAAQNNSGQVFQYIAEAHGYLEEEGVEVEMQYINNGTDAFQAMSGGKVDIMSTYGTGGPLIQISQGNPYTIFAGYMITGETPCFGKPETEWTDLNSFVGKKIGITRFGTPDVVLKGVLYDAGILDQVEFVEYKKNQEVLQAIANGEIEFGATATGYELQAADLGLEVKMWPDDYWHDHSCCRMLCMDEFIANEEKQEAIYRVLRAYIRAEEYMRDHMDEVVDLVVENLDLDEATVESFVKSPHMKYNIDPNKHAVFTMWDKMKAFGYIESDDVNLEDHFNTAVYQRAIESLVKDYPDDKYIADKMTEFETNNL